MIAAMIVALAGAASASPASRQIGGVQSRDVHLVQLSDRWKPGGHLDRGPGPAFDRDRGARTFGYEYAPAPFYGYRAYRPRVAAPERSQRSIGSGAPPLSERWHSHCRQEYRSFDPHTGTTTSRTGEQRFCR